MEAALQPIAIGASLSDLASVVADALRPVRALFVPRAERELFAAAMRASDFVSARIAGVVDADELDARLDVLIEDPAFFGFEIDAARRVPANVLERAATLRVPAREDFPNLAVLTAAIVVEAFTFERTIARARLEVVGTLGRIPVQALEQIAGSPFEFIAAPDVPARVGRAFLSSLRGEAALLALVPLLSDPAPSPWLARALAVRWRDGKREMLRVLALLAPAVIPVEVLPNAERLNPEELARQVERYKQTLSRIRDQAEASGLPVFPPDPIDGTA